MFADNLKQLRKRKQHTQTDMAERLGVAKTTYASYEQGRRMPDAEIQKKIADFFDVTLDELHGRSSLKQEDPETLMFKVEGLKDLPDEEIQRIEQTLIEQALFMIERSKKK